MKEEMDQQTKKREKREKSKRHLDKQLKGSIWGE